ncbi:MBL fold hydrolase [Dictyobacter alpinus]|uniref:MBL fold hydrolase n=1 Tax=Dictyobacter alpinus TaxID=2014873 RepID=A0A402B3K7_9CHLR|nr:MBL fold metallo-hydrolase [Dictyobacter alpinus]GCE25928.1 MBL fold hydrolase [Dictyobacter alpinus]
MSQQHPSTAADQSSSLSVHKVAEHIWQITLPIPLPLKTVNVYALEGKTGWVLVDAGMGVPGTREAFYAGIAQAGLQVQNLQAIVLTHLHPDHIGLAGELHEMTQVPVLMHPLDEAALYRTWGDQIQTYIETSNRFFEPHGLSTATHWSTTMSPEMLHSILRIPPRSAFQAIEDGQQLQLADESYRVLWLPGHSDGQIGLFRERDGIFLSADHVLPRITPNIGRYSPQDRPDPLQDFFQSLTKISSLPAKCILPGHGDVFTDLTNRITEIMEHHQRRLTQIIDLLEKQPQNATQLTKQLFGTRLKSHEALRLAVAEILAHLEYLRLRQQLIQQKNQAGILYYIVATTSP